MIKKTEILRILEERKARLADSLIDDALEAELEVLINKVNNLLKEGEWIPVEKGLPETNDGYLCTMKGELCGQEEPFTGICWIEDGEWDEPDCVLAWQPLPEPYKSTPNWKDAMIRTFLGRPET